MREILFRGKAANRIDGRAYRTSYKNGDWVYGLLTDVENYAGFSEMTNTNGVSGIEVDKNTVSQFTGLSDKTGKKIFEGDICQNTRTGEIVSVKWHGTMAGFVWSKRQEKSHLFDFGELFRAYDKYVVIGNIHDNPELMAVKTSPSTEEEPE